MTEPIVIVNPTDRDWTHHRYILWFDAYASTRLMIWANSLDSALDEAIDWIADNAPGILADDEVRGEFERLKSERAQCSLDIGEDTDPSDDESLWDEATVNTTCAGNAGRYLHSWEWGIVAEDPTRAEVLAIMGRDAEGERIKSWQARCAKISNAIEAYRLKAS